MPVGADRVLIQENVAADGEQVRLTSDYPDALRHVRQRGFDFAAGDALIGAGTCLNVAHIALAASAGHSSLTAGKPPKVAILDSGDELVADPASAIEHELPASNGIMLNAMLTQLGCETVPLGPVGDDAAALAEALKGAEDADLLVTTGGASVGDHDLMKPALEAWGAELQFWRVAMKPGKPVMVARRTSAAGHKQAIFGLPGNPVSAYVTAFLFVLPFVRASMGAANPALRPARMVTSMPLPAVGPRREFVRGFWDGTSVAIVGLQDSSALAALASANCLIDRPAHAPELPAGETVPTYWLGDSSAA